MKNVLCKIMYSMPDAIANIKGSDLYPHIIGITRFYQMRNGVAVATEINGLPSGDDILNECFKSNFALHIHQGEICDGDYRDPFAKTLGHFNPYSCEHPFHAGDLPPLFESDGYALSIVFIDRFKVKDIIGKTIVIHSMPDDFHTQPSGNAGEKIACGVIKEN